MAKFTDTLDLTPYPDYYDQAPERIGRLVKALQVATNAEISEDGPGWDPCQMNSAIFAYANLAVRALIEQVPQDMREEYAGMVEKHCNIIIENTKRYAQQ